MQDITKQKPVRSNRRILLLSVAVATAGLVASLLVSTVSSNDKSDRVGTATVDANASDNILLAPVEWAKDVAAWAKKSAHEERRTCNPQYDYPGCTPSQQRALEAPDKSDFKANYDKGRWGQGDDGGKTRAQWDNLTDDNNAKMRQMYRDAVDRFEAAKRSATAQFQTWGEFKANMDCGGNFGVFSGLVTGWCRSQQPINWTVEQTENLFLDCGGDFLGGAFAGGLAAKLKWVATTIKVGAMRASVLASIPCVVNQTWEVLFSWADKAKTHLVETGRVG
jgi:hypothetical protein